ncbi:LytR C-terminal domain-containing protein [Arthrobacter humicola]|uniref:LytR C-terminal domain-containing protein n=1 Tax=Arthrobacter humicola TaxID=409291 RepID=UPI001FAB7788|nr:LytR C-terminal domain-containing protein [Arthrobacter humicola]MCI9872250.1 LytR C-terminal domain-containing protein [Arthrobacter humicola]
MTKYARDEFDRVPETSARQGVHRAVAASRRRSLAPILAAGCVALAIGLVAFLILPKLGFSAGQAAAVTAGGSPSASASSSPSATSTVSPGPTPTSPEPAGTDAAAPAASPSATPSATAAAVDKTQPVTIYNATTTAGLATRVGGTVTSDGWVLGETGNWGGVPQQTSVIFYSGVEQKDNAEALGALLGVDTLVDSAEFNMPLVVVLGPGYQ